MWLDSDLWSHKWWCCGTQVRMMQDLMLSGRCHWVMWLDSDAFLKMDGFRTSIDDWLLKVGDVNLSRF